jgi:predicted nucleotidyltransferase
MLNLRSQLRRKLLAYYFTNPTAEHYLRELARLLQVSPTNLSRELASLVRQGLFAARVRGRQKHFRINREHPLYEEFQRIVFKTIGAVGRLRAGLAKIPGIKDAFLYGSFARNQEDPASDIDVLVVGKPPAQRLEAEIGKLERELKREINYTLMSEKEFADRRAKKDPFLADVFRHKTVKLSGS